MKEFIDDGTLLKSCLRRLEHADVPQVVWTDRSSFASLRVFAPNAAQNLFSRQVNNQNATSAVLILDYQSTRERNRIVFGADSQLQEWKDIHGQYGTITCDVLGGPHHGGHVGGTVDDMKWIYATAIHAKVAVISAATTSKHHPRMEVVESLTGSGASVMCSQISKKCTKNLEAEPRAPEGDARNQ